MAKISRIDIKLFLFLFLLACFPRLTGQTAADVHTNRVFNEKIHTVQLYREGWNLSYPLIKLNNGEKLELHFDLLADQPETYYYTFIHCDKDWKTSDIFINDYLDGYEENPVENYKASFNTTVSYYHYSLTFPNDRVNLKASGNYVILVYVPGKKEKPELVQRFMISEDAVGITLTAHRPQMTRDNNTHQQVDFTVNHGGLELNDPYRNVYAFVLQNGRWDNAKVNLKPEFYGDNELKYNSLSDKNIFAGGNEYRYFDIKSIRYQSEYVRSIEFKAPFYNVYLQPSENRERKPYFYWKDFNGKYYIAFQEGQDPQTDADYVYVYFTLPSDQKLSGGNLYVDGALTDWQLNSDNLMKYNEVKRQYECTMLLKQGWYIYEYIFLKDGDQAAVTGPFEGNHYETENDYVVLVYYRNPRERYDHLIGSNTVNTLNKISD
jgi:hypothetical protein